MQFADNRHAVDEMLERYSMGSLEGVELAELEEHLMVCGFCQDRLTREDHMTQGFRDGAAVVRRPREVVWWPFPKLAWALGLAAVGLLVFAGSAWQSLRRVDAVPPAVIVLQAMRGTENPSLAAAPARKPLTLVLDLADVQQLSEYKLEIVDAAGNPALQSRAVAQNNKLQIIIGRGLTAGAYFVRVYAPAGELLREYALNVHG